MDERKKGILAVGVIAGLAAIVATGAYLRSESGRRFLADANKRLQSGKRRRK